MGAEVMDDSDGGHDGAPDGAYDGGEDGACDGGYSSYRIMQLWERHLHEALAHVGRKMIVECALLELAVHEAVVERIFAVPAEHLLALGERADDAPRLSCDVLGRRLGRGARSCSCRAGANWLQRYDMVWVSNPP